MYGIPKGITPYIQKSIMNAFQKATKANFCIDVFSSIFIKKSQHKRYFTLGTVGCARMCAHSVWNSFAFGNCTAVYHTYQIVLIIYVCNISFYFQILKSPKVSSKPVSGTMSLSRREHLIAEEIPGPESCVQVYVYLQISYAGCNVYCMINCKLIGTNSVPQKTRLLKAKVSAYITCFFSCWMQQTGFLDIYT